MSDKPCPVCSGSGMLFDEEKEKALADVEAALRMLPSVYNLTGHLTDIVVRKDARERRYDGGGVRYLIDATERLLGLEHPDHA